MEKLKNNTGVTLVEILLGIIISTVMMGAMYTSYNAVSGSYSQVSDRAKISNQVWVADPTKCSFLFPEE